MTRLAIARPVAMKLDLPCDEIDRQHLFTSLSAYYVVTVTLIVILARKQEPVWTTTATRVMAGVSWSESKSLNSRPRLYSSALP